MKKILVFLLSLLLLSGCGKKEEEEEEIHFDYEIQSEAVDMSAYSGVNSTKHCFRLVTCAELFSTIDNGGSGVFYLGRSNCQCCQDVTKYVNEIGLELGVTIYYIDVYNEKENLSEDKDLQDKLHDYMYDILGTDDDGEKVLLTPHLFQVVNGQLKDNQICHDGIFTVNPTDEQIEELKEVYRRILSPFASASQD